MTHDLQTLLWPASRLGEALQTFAQTRTEPPPHTAQWDPDWIESAARSLGLEAQPVEIHYADLESSLSKIGPALVRIPGKDGRAAFLILLSNRVALGPAGEKVRVTTGAVRSALCAEMEAPVIREIEETLQRSGIPEAKRASALNVILRERFTTKPIRGIWIVRLPPSANFWLQLRQARVVRRLVVLGGAHAIQYAVWILAWWVVGANVLNGRGDPSWIFLWALLLLTLVPLRVLITWMQGLLAFGVGARLKQRLLFGALRLEPDSIRHQGAGQLLGRVLESEAVEALALSGGFLAVVALIEIVFALAVLAGGAGGMFQSACLLAWLLVTAGIASKYFRRNLVWTDVRLAMTHDLVENMVGHRTRLAQLAPGHWHDGEDKVLEQYVPSSKLMDKSTAALLSIVPRGWLVVGLIGLAPGFVQGAASPARMAIAVGGMLLAYRALRRLTWGAWQLAGAAVAWQRVAVLYDAAKHPEAVGTLDAEHRETARLVDARDIWFRYSERTEPVLKSCNLQIDQGDRLVLEGVSGGGKSTLVSVLSGLRKPDSGRLVIAGFDHQALGEDRWHRCIAAAPQFHENHVLAETFAFNLFLGKTEILSSSDWEKAAAICNELGLGDLLERMPAGMHQIVGETGWQLSHGERSRLYIARALIQDADLVVLDESFAALDPENLQRALECVLKRARSLLVIAHR